MSGTHFSRLTSAMPATLPLPPHEARSIRRTFQPLLGELPDLLARYQYSHFTVELGGKR